MNDEHRKDTSFYLSVEQIKTVKSYKSYLREIENNGYQNLNIVIDEKTETVKIYTPELAVILTSKVLTAINQNTKTETQINGWDYLDTYNEAYKDGEQYFEREFKVSPEIIYGKNAELYVKNIHNNFFHIVHKTTFEGWNYVKNNWPLILSHKNIRDFGYFSGIVNKVEEQIKKHLTLFTNFDKCEHNSLPQQSDTNKEIEPFNPEIFLDQYSYDLFLFLVDEYATSKRPKQFSQLFHWMQRQNFIKPTTGKKYQKFVRERFPEMVAKFSRIDIRNRDEITTLNELRKKFNSLN